MAASQHRPRICFVVSAPGTAATFLNPHIEVLSGNFDVSVIANVANEDHQISGAAAIHHVPIQRDVHIPRDLKALRSLRRTLRAGGFDIVHSVTPKAGLLTALASIGLRIPNRLHWYTGQVWVTRSGLKRRALKILDRFIALRSTLQLVDSPSQRSFLIEQQVVSDRTSLVLGSGSICGVDTERFRPNRVARRQIRQLLDIAEHDLIIIFIGRLNLDKGLGELTRAFEYLSGHEEAHLLLLGADEVGAADLVRNQCSTSQHRVHLVGNVIDPERYLASADIFCLPSHREGFGLSAIEAASCALPTVVTEIYGLTDAVQNGKTGLYVPPNDPVSLSETLHDLMRKPTLRSNLGEAGRRRVFEQYQVSTLTSALLHLNLDLIGHYKESPTRS